MKLDYTVANIADVLAVRAEPAITRWNRLEGRPRTHNFDRALKAEVRDPLWMLAKQWQMGEFIGEDAGSPVMARVCIDTAKIDNFQRKLEMLEPIDLTAPLESRVEAKPLPLRSGQQFLSLDLRMSVGRRWLKLLARDRAAGLLSADYRDDYLLAYPVRVPDPTQASDAFLCAHAAAWQAVSAAAGRAMDGIDFLDHLKLPGAKASDDVGVAAGDEAHLTDLADKLRLWFEDLLVSAGDGDCWLADRLEYQFGCAAPDTSGSTRLRATEFSRGELDWHALEESDEDGQFNDGDAPAPAPSREVHAFIPTGVVFEGMPATRWWAFEDRRTNFGDMKPDTVDLGKLLLMEFALVYANDWFVLPHTLDLGTVTKVRGIAVTNTFGERLWVEPIADDPDAGLTGWGLFDLGGPGDETSPLVILPTGAKVQQGKAVEEIAFVRDEMANMVWAIERRVPLPSGASKPGRETARELRAFLQKPLVEELKNLVARKAELDAIPASERTPAEQDELDATIDRLNQIRPPEAVAPIRYEVMNEVPENWIPFVPVHVPDNVREIQLQRAAMPRLLQGADRTIPPERVRPRTTLLRNTAPGAYFVHEEEVPRAGALVTQSYRRTRWLGGRVFTWFAAQKQTGRGEGSSGLAFDQLQPAEPAR